MLEATVCLGYLDLCQGYPWTVGTNRGGCKRVWHNRGSASAAAQLAPSATRHRRCGHRSNGLPRQSGVVAAASSTRPCGHRGRQAACGHGMKRQGRRHVAHDRERGIGDRDRGAKRQKGRRGVGKTQNPANDAGDADAGDGKEDEAVQAALHESRLTHEQHISATSGLSGVPQAGTNRKAEC